MKIINNEVTVFVKNIKTSEKKISNVLTKIRKKSYFNALEILNKIPSKSKIFIWKALHSAAANAKILWGSSKNALFIKEIKASKGLKLKRINPRAKGKFDFLTRNFSHLKITLCNINN
jgi:large subunit ribosomal protein L22